MPLIDDEVTLDDRYPMGLAETRPVPAQPEGARPSLLGAAFRQENLVAAAIDAYHPSFKEEKGHDPLSIIKDSIYEDEYLDNFVGSRSEAETRYIMGRIDRESKDRERMAQGGAWGVAAGIAAGTLDPTILIPVGGPVLKIGQAGKATVSVGRTAAKYGAITGAASAVQEGGLQYTQEIRPWQESAIGIGAGTILGSILGGAIGTLSKRQVAKLTETLDAARKELAGRDASLDDGAVGTISAGASAGAAAVGRAGTGAIEGTLGASKALSGVSPVTRLQTHEFDEARDAVRHMADGGLMLAENKQGIATSPGGTVENRITRWNGGLARAVQSVDDAYSRYWYGQSKFAGRVRARIGSETARYTGRLGTKLTAKQFREEVGMAMARGDTHAIPEVQEAAQAMRKEVFDPLLEAAVRARLLPEGVQAVGALSYITRIYNRQRIIAQRQRFGDILFRHFRAGNADMPDAEVRDLVDGVIDTIIGSSPFRMPGLDMVQGPRGPLKERVLRVPDEAIEEFLERDIETVARFYTRTMAPDVELATKFGDVQMMEPLRKLLDEKNRRIALATTDKQRAKLEERFKDAQRDIEALRDRLRHTYRLPDDPDGLPYRLAKIAQQVNYLRLMGMMTLRAIPDLARPIMVHGLTRTFSDGFAPLVRNLGRGKLKLARGEVKAAGTALDMVLDTRARAMADLFDDWQRGTKLERVLDAATNRFGLVSLMAPWNASMKQFTGIVVINGVLKATKAVAEGTATAKQVRNLAASGIDEGVALRIWQQFQNGGGSVERGLHLPNTEDWTDRIAKEALQVAIVRDVDRTIVTPGVELPLFMSHPLGKLISQFKSFTFSSTQRTLLAGLQQKDMAFVNGLMLTMGLGALGTYLSSDLVTGKADTSKWTPTKWGVEAVDYSGVLTLLSEVNNIAEKMSWGRIGMSAITGEMASRYMSRGAVGALLGPSLDLVNDAAFVLPGALMNQEWTASDTRALRKILPFQNLFYIRRLLDQVEAGTNSALGIPQKRQERK
jgi:hypothetical protein